MTLSPPVCSRVLRARAVSLTSRLHFMGRPRCPVRDAPEEDRAGVDETQQQGSHGPDGDTANSRLLVLPMSRRGIEQLRRVILAPVFSDLTTYQTVDLDTAEVQGSAAGWNTE
jgi:hypothetical protein